MAIARTGPVAQWGTLKDLRRVPFSCLNFPTQFPLPIPYPLHFQLSPQGGHKALYFIPPFDSRNNAVIRGGLGLKNTKGKSPSPTHLTDPDQKGDGRREAEAAHNPLAGCCFNCLRQILRSQGPLPPSCEAWHSLCHLSLVFPHQMLPILLASLHMEFGWGLPSGLPHMCLGQVPPSAVTFLRCSSTRHHPLPCGAGLGTTLCLVLPCPSYGAQPGATLYLASSCRRLDWVIPHCRELGLTLSFTDFSYVGVTVYLTLNRSQLGHVPPSALLHLVHGSAQVP